MVYHGDVSLEVGGGWCFVILLVRITQSVWRYAQIEPAGYPGFVLDGLE